MTSELGASRMRTKGRILLFVAAVLLPVVLLVSCASPRERAFQDLLPAERAQVDLKMSLMTAHSEVRLNWPIHLLLENESPTAISFPVDFGAQIYAYQRESDEWIEVENRVTYLKPEERIVLAPLDQVPFNQMVFRAWPQAHDALDLRYLRIMVIGRQLEGEEPAGPPVVGFLEVELNH
jgi:hypothetical protein